MESLISFMQNHRYLGELFTFLIAFAESLPIIGTIVPGSLTMTSVGIMIGSTILPPIPTLAWAVAGAFIGDYIGFWLGAHYKTRITQFWPFSKYPKWIEKGQDFFEKHGIKSVIIGRFIGPVRSTTPLIAGVMDMSMWKFFAAALPSAVMWAILYLTPGVILGALSLEVPHGEATRVILSGFAIILLLWALFWLIQFSFRQIVGGVNHLIDYWWDWLNRHPKPHRIIQWITRRPQPTDHRQLTMLVMAIVTGVLFLALLVMVKLGHAQNGINTAVFYFLQSIRNTGMDYFFCIFSLLGAKPVIIGYALILTAWFASQRDWRTVRFWLLLLALTVGSLGACKVLMHNPRPLGFAVHITSSSFPSGHTALAYTILTFAAYLLCQRIPHRFRALVIWPTVLFIVLVALSRLYLGAHWFTDVIGSFLLGTSILLIVLTCFRRHAWQLEAERYWFLSIFLVGLFIPWFAYTLFEIKTLHSERQRVYPTYNTTIKEWWQAPTPFLPTYRLNRLGQPIQPFNIQWAGYPDEIEQRLRDSGWHILSLHLSLRSAAQRIASDRPEYHSPIFTPLFRGTAPEVSMYKTLPNSHEIVEIRLWQSGIKFTDSPKPLYVGTVDFHIQLPKQYTLQSFSNTVIITNDAIKELIPNLGGLRYQVVVLPDDRVIKDKKHLAWNQRVLVVWDL